jgi:hypothetical protein
MILADRILFTNATGNWGEMLHALGDRIRPNLAAWEETVKDFHANVDHAWFEDLAVPTETLQVLRTLNDLGEAVTPNDLADLLEQPVESVRQVINWADLLNIVQVKGRNLWALDHLVGRLISRFGT